MSSGEWRDCLSDRWDDRETTLRRQKLDKQMNENLSHKISSWTNPFEKVYKCTECEKYLYLQYERPESVDGYFDQFSSHPDLPWFQGKVEQRLIVERFDDIDCRKD